MIQALIPAYNCDNDIIATTTRVMIDRGWPLLEYFLLDGILMKAQLYLDDVEGLEWYVVEASRSDEYGEEIQPSSKVFQPSLSYPLPQ
jgi:hypothetical protein